MSDIDKLTGIRAKCVELLRIAEKRTPGKWVRFYKRDTIAVQSEHDPDIVSWSGFDDSARPSGFHAYNAKFIAACAGPMEAACKSTIAAIDGLTLTCEGFKFPDEDRPYAWQAIQEILTAWEGVV